MLAGEFALRIWSPGAVAPAAAPPLHTGELALERTLLGVEDGSISRAANAPKLRATGPTTLHLSVPATSARSVLVFEGTRFEALQHGVPPSEQAWKIAPGQLSRPARLARGPSASVALVRQLDWERPGATHHLLLLPRALELAPGTETDLSAPALLVIGESALDITPTDTLVPAAIPADVPVSSFRLRELDLALDAPTLLDNYAPIPAAGPFRIPGEDTDVPAPALEAVAARLLDQAFRAHCFFLGRSLPQHLCRRVGAHQRGAGNPGSGLANR